MAVRAADRYRQVIEKTINENVLGDPVEWDFSPVVVPQMLQAGAEPVCAYLLVLSCRSLLLSPPRVAVTDMLWDSCPSDEQIRTEVIASLDGLFKTRIEVSARPDTQGMS